ncbi:MAG: lipoyl protein ligase domain-containing protein [Ilumatobacteraceae bacterium]
MPGWRIEHAADVDVGAFHARPLSEQRSATFFHVRSSTLVAGSSQRDQSIDTNAAAQRGIDVVRRRSGGGGVLLVPGEHVWLDLEIPASDALWNDDVGRATWWVGELWRAALAPVAPLASVHTGRMRRTRWSDDICFAGVGPGEVLVGDAKLVGVSQRRTRLAARFQTMVHLRWRAEVVAALVADGPPAEIVAPLVATCEASTEEIMSRLIAALALI